MLDGTLFAGNTRARFDALRNRRRWAQAAATFINATDGCRWHTARAALMIGWIAGEYLIIDSFIWPHALWSGLGVTHFFSSWSCSACSAFEQADALYRYERHPCDPSTPRTGKRQPL